MKRFPRNLSFSAAAALLSALAPIAPAQEAERPTEADLTRRIEEQSAQIRILIREVSRLADAVEALGSGRTASQPAPAPARAEPAPAPAPPQTGTDQETAVAEPARTGPIHVVNKGETLTSIARQHGVALDELMKLNGIADGRNLQSGQTLRLPVAPPATENP